MSCLFGFGDDDDDERHCYRSLYSNELSRLHAYCFGELVDVVAIAFDFVDCMVAVALFFFGNSI